MPGAFPIHPRQRLACRTAQSRKNSSSTRIPKSSLDFEIVRQAARQKYTRPFLIVDTAIVREKVRRFRAAMPRVRPHYAVKANPDRRVVKALMQEGCRFEIASTAELDLLLSLGVDAAEVFYSNPVTSRAVDRLRRGQGRRVVRRRQRGRVAPRARDQGRREDLPAHRDPEHRQRLAAVGQVRRRHGRGARDRPGRGEARRGPRRRDVPRRLPVPQPGKLARRHREGAQRCSIRWRGRPQAAHARHRRRLPGAARQADPFDRGDRRGGERGAEGISGRRAGRCRAGPLPRVGRRLFRLPRHRHHHARAASAGCTGMRACSAA